MLAAIYETFDDEIQLPPQGQEMIDELIKIRQAQYLTFHHFDALPAAVWTRIVPGEVSADQRLYEPEPGEAFASARPRLYVRRWVGWVQAGLAVALSTGCLRPNRSNPVGGAVVSLSRSRMRTRTSLCCYLTHRRGPCPHHPDYQSGSTLVG